MSLANLQMTNYNLCISPYSGIAGVFLALCTISLRHRLAEHCVQLNFDQVIGLAKVNIYLLIDILQLIVMWHLTVIIDFCFRYNYIIIFFLDN